ncbi:MAG TPA: glycoside hydrolase family 15 protein [Candidatus Dormibacteraeota bacterium]|nr:glycoside hydrolase family 15 protein [Candidatus Dormibacteraeota bacterium]
MSTGPDASWRPRAADHALLADGRTAALVSADGEVAWLCWPRIDSDPVLLPLLDAEAGGTFSVRPADASASVEARQAVDEGLVTRTVWRAAEGRLVVDDALAWEGPASLLRLLRAERRPVTVEVRFRPSFGWGTAAPDLETNGRRAVASGAGLRLAVDGPAGWTLRDGVAVCAFRVVPGYPAAVALREAGDVPAGLADVPDRLAATLRHWRAALDACELDLDPSSLAVRALGPEVATRLQRRAAAVLVGLRHRGGGLVAAATTSLPQAPGTGRTWDYRYAWPRDTSLAARALLRLGLTDDAHTLGAFVGDVCAEGSPPALVRVDESPPPEERELAHLAGYEGGRVIRVGNAAAAQTQLDVVGECLELAWDLARARALPESLRRAVPRLAETAAREAWTPDHGIWEIRGEPGLYTHSRVAAWAGLRHAAGLAEAGVCEGDAARWSAAAAAIRARVLRECVDASGALTLRAGGGGADAALAEALTGGFLAPGDPRAAATLDAITTRLARGALVDRYEGQPDGLGDPCLPFVFATFWVAAAEDACGRDGAGRFGAAAASRGALDLMGEVADPATSTPHGNVPQAQSHASLVLAAASRVARRA